MLVSDLAGGSLVEESILSRCRFVSYGRPDKLLWYGHWDSNPENHGPKPCGYSNSPMPAYKMAVAGPHLPMQPLKDLNGDIPTK